MPSEDSSPKERNKTLIRSFIEEIFNEHNLSSIEKYFGKDSIWDNSIPVSSYFFTLLFNNSSFPLPAKKSNLLFTIIPC
jgi:hypothetical protein